MMKLLLVLLMLGSNVFAGDFPDVMIGITPTPIMGFVIPQKLEFHTIKAFYQMAIKEYKEANYGSSKELFEEIVKRTDAFPKAYFYLGDIYGHTEPFVNKKLAKAYYKQCIAHRKTSNELKQICYIKLSWLDGTSKEEIESYKVACKKLGDTYYSKWIQVPDITASGINEALEMAGRAEDSKKETDKDIFKRANYIVGE
jgi:hypothetical protein